MVITSYRAIDLLVFTVELILARLLSNTKDCKSSDQILALDGYFLISDTLIYAVLLLGSSAGCWVLQPQLRE